MKVVVFGCQQIAVDFIRFIIDRDNVTLSLIVTYELPLDKTYGYESVIDEFSSSEIKVLNPRRVNSELVEEIRGIQPDIIFSIYYRQILPQSLLEIPTLGCINIHPGLLPKYRGPIPTAWAIQNGEKEFGITLHYMDKGIDTGEIIIQEKYNIIHDETGYELYTRAMKLGTQLLKNNFEKFINGNTESVVQKGRGSYYGKKNGKYLIDWQLPAEDIRNMIRVHAEPFNPAEALLFNRYIFINKSKVVYDEKYPEQGVGKIVDIVDGNKLVISCAEGCLLLEDFKIVPELTDEEKEIYFKIGNKLE
jgi:methionyl-tRNA formyltransferase